VVKKKLTTKFHEGPDNYVILHNSCNSLADYFFDLKMNMFYILLPPSQPSPKGEGAKILSPLGEIRKGVLNQKISVFMLPKF
jgi:hypothetical protein